VKKILTLVIFGGAMALSSLTVAGSAPGANGPRAVVPGQFNMAPIKEVIARVRQKIENHEIEIPQKASVSAGFEVDENGALSKVRLIQSSGSKAIDAEMLDVMRALSDSHVLSALYGLTSNTIRVDLTDGALRVALNGVAATAEDAKAKADSLKLLLSVARISQRSKNPAAAELLGLVHISTDNKRVATELSVDRLTLMK